MCGGNYTYWQEPRQLLKINNEPIVARTIRLLKENGIEDIAISTHDEKFNQFGVPILHHENTFTTDDQHATWVEAFYPTFEPVCYIWGDVVFSPEAIKEIVNDEVRYIQFYASRPPFAKDYIKDWAEPFALKVIDQELLHKAIRIVKKFYKELKFKREPIVWELWQVIKGTKINVIDYFNYHAINDYTCDVDSTEDARKLNEIICRYDNLHT